MTSCNVCLNDVVLPIKSMCHLYCFLCIKEYQLLTNETTKCPLCNIYTNYMNISVIQNDYCVDDLTLNYLWIYSSNYNDTWWAYNNASNKQIEKIHQDYILNQELIKKLSNNNSDPMQITIQNFKKYNNSQMNKKNNQILTFDNINVNNIDNNIIIDDTSVDFDEFYDSDELIDKTNKLTDKSLHNEPLSYIIKCGTIGSSGYYEYKIDFDSMKQINVMDSWKTRSIKRLELPIDIMITNINKITEYLQSLKVIGIAGKNFEMK